MLAILLLTIISHVRAMRPVATNENGSTSEDPLQHSNTIVASASYVVEKDSNTNSIASDSDPSSPAKIETNESSGRRPSEISLSGRLMKPSNFEKEWGPDIKDNVYFNGNRHTKKKQATGALLTALGAGFAFDAMRETLGDMQHGNSDGHLVTGNIEIYHMALIIVCLVAGLYLLSQVMFKDSHDGVKAAGMVLMTLSGLSGSLGVILLGATGGDTGVLCGMWITTGAFILVALILRLVLNEKAAFEFQWKWSWAGHVVGVVCLVAASGMMADRIREAINTNQGIDGGWAFFMFTLGALGLFWFVQLAPGYSFNNKGPWYEQKAMYPLFMSVCAAALFTGGACCVGTSNTVGSAMCFGFGALLLILIPIGLWALIKFRDGKVPCTQIVWE